ncbi:hypothetical protein DPMN_172815 [Dreissena polymorpha]|uniref:Uncharacterized protein n=1 Tax=Dreissena polymorpha TaxID=45954 RepID=A0A9D4E299_DREPO|nr:hypothetical protein DPMN_172815 [Dreissena polymorpha]
MVPLDFQNHSPFQMTPSTCPILVGGDAFSLSRNMQKPYGHRVLTRDERILNYRLSRASRVSEMRSGLNIGPFSFINKLFGTGILSKTA